MKCMNWLDGWKKGSTSGTYICTLTKLETAIEGAAIIMVLQTEKFLNQNERKDDDR